MDLFDLINATDQSFWITFSYIFINIRCVCIKIGDLYLHSKAFLVSSDSLSMHVLAILVIIQQYICTLPKILHLYIYIFFVSGVGSSICESWRQQKWKALRLNILLCLSVLHSFCYRLDYLASTVLRLGKSAVKLTVCILSPVSNSKLIVSVAILCNLKFSVKNPLFYLSD